jgi:hypothetical protein
MTFVPAVVAAMRKRDREKSQKMMMGNEVEQKLCKMFTSHRR